MATLSQSPLLLQCATSACPLTDIRRKTTPHIRKSTLVSCSADQRQPSPLLLDRRNVLMALGGLHGVATDVNAALANPVSPPVLKDCHPSTAAGVPEEYLKCCPPYANQNLTIYDYDYPETAIRVRRPAHLVVNDAAYMKKYTAAVAAMKKLDNDKVPNPWSYIQQSKVHCAYCNGGFDQVGFNDNVPIQVHFSWFFLPWHRFYIHFYERILGKLIDDDTFALPYWNWDSPAGMEFPAIFNDTGSPLYDEKRNPQHMAPAVIDFQYDYDKERTVPDYVKIRDNLELLRKEFRDGKNLPELFMGDPLRAGEASNASLSSGGLERIHNVGHKWVGPGVKGSPNFDMGSFVTAGRDSVFYSHHSNVDRLWYLFRQSRGNRVEFNDPDWLDSTFLFYDESRRLTRVKLSDSLNNLKLRYVYEDSPSPYLSAKRKPATKASGKQALPSYAKGFGDAPRRLEEEIRAVVARPKKRRTATEKDEEVEVLFVEGIDVKNNEDARFDVFVSTPGVEPELAGSFITLSHNMGAGMSSMRKMTLKLGLTALLEEIDAEDEDAVVVTFTPRNGDVTIGGVSIKLVKTEPTDD